MMLPVELSDTEEGLEEDICHIGIPKSSPAWSLRSKFFPCKLGGPPAWLALSRLPSPASMACQHCDDPTLFLTQLYSPIDSDPSAFHRTLFVFVCPKPKCSRPNDPGCFKVFRQCKFTCALLALRNQLPMENRFYPPSPPVMEEAGSEEPSAQAFGTALCWLCGSLGPKRCGSCSKASYCSKAHQVEDWRRGHKQECKGPKEECEGSSKCKGPPEGPKCRPGVFFPEFELEIESVVMEDDEETDGDEGDVPDSPDDAETRALEAMAQKDQGGKAWKRFRGFCRENPEAVVRFERDGTPLHISQGHEDEQKVPPDCETCGAPRRFEFQLLPQLLNKLQLDDQMGDSLDWGTVLVYTCSKNCSPDYELYSPEVVFKEDFQ
ncbi:unnamed protein product [Cyprideis torosa]|uniref:Uncharacterized protein n=1 Tax=Cyprideis torosa TaxID=163714 RepID=A0A7R8ZSN3_9CRUS|nr:unnamed protein product [Cyprideis torosa]CAG0902122.1 unnamed protein product [Cyprideis torosa]